MFRLTSARRISRQDVGLPVLVPGPVGVAGRRRRRRLDPLVDAFVGADEVQVLRDGGAHGVVAVAETENNLEQRRLDDGTGGGSSGILNHLDDPGS